MRMMKRRRRKRSSTNSRMVTSSLRMTAVCGYALCCVTVTTVSALQQQQPPILARQLPRDTLMMTTTATSDSPPPPPMPSPPSPLLLTTGTTMTTEEEDPLSILLSRSRPYFHRALGSQELLMLPRQYGPALPEGQYAALLLFPCMMHVCAVRLSSTPHLHQVREAVACLMRDHPLLRAHVIGDGEPDQRIDLFQMVRQGNPHPPTFVDAAVVVTDDANTTNASLYERLVDQVVHVVTVPKSRTPDHALKTSWQESFQVALNRDHILQDNVHYNHHNNHPHNNLLWKLEFHTLQQLPPPPPQQQDIDHVALPLSSSSSSSLHNTPCALVFSFNHAISDQSSAHRMIDQLLRQMHEMEKLEMEENTMTGDGKEEEGSKLMIVQRSHAMPVSVEDSVLGLNQRWKDVQLRGVSAATLAYVASKVGEGLGKAPVVLLPDHASRHRRSRSSSSSVTSSIIPESHNPQRPRQSVVTFRSLNATLLQSLLDTCRKHQVSLSNALTSAMTLTVSDFVGIMDDTGMDNECEYDDENVDMDDDNRRRQRTYKILQSLDMRRFGAQLDTGETVACMAGSHDLMHTSIPDGSGRAIRRRHYHHHDRDGDHRDGDDDHGLFWTLARDAKKQTTAFIKNHGPEQALRVFDFAMTIADVGNLVYLTSQSQATQGRAYSAGVTNVGVYERTKSFAPPPHDHDPQGNDNNDNSTTRNNHHATSTSTLKTSHGRFNITDIFFATSHTHTGCLYPVSALTIHGELKLTFHPASPIVSETTNEKFANAFVELLETIATTRPQLVSASYNQSERTLPSFLMSGTGTSSYTSASSIILNQLPFVSALLGAVAIASHGPAWLRFFQSMVEMNAHVEHVADFTAALNFWLFFAVGHTLLQPILWISDVMHGTPGPKVIADLVPALFLAGNAVVISALAISKEIRNAVNIAIVAAFFAYIGAGLDGTAGLGDFNLAIDDSYKSQVVKGCPAYEDVRQPSMDNFNLIKYQGLWYEHKFHDWTQFKEVYDTTLNIKLTDDGQGWVDDFAVKGPAPDAAKLSWDKSPVANGAHYFLFGRVDKNDPPGVLREKGFGVEFPNYIVDVQKNPSTGEYTEAIQFQCLERGGVRVFEGINFLSRDPVTTNEQLSRMHERANAAGMYPYGASPEQMHTVARKIDKAPIDNNWQAMWRAVGVDKLLELLTKSIEDGGR